VFSASLSRKHKRGGRSDESAVLELFLVQDRKPQQPQILPAVRHG